ncbi:acyltransferase family protein [Salinimonas sediminis]|uniref:Acyltransferase 3 domain-containing protein n=1 Tax=Salinimonas sediminis TaxID=2303538 RepID=A0A346NMV1_9ALTE|nr:acyltransferase family protein [Salinimonas sediminis]AXR06858.1 hypothetical protein D0Y50_11115 [Salinimonas sediminis]
MDLSISRPRIDHIDVAKGVSIILVAIYHSQLRLFYSDIMDALSVVRMPFFFFISGVFFSYKASFSIFAMNKFQALLKPYFFISLVVTVFYIIFRDIDVILLLGVIYATGSTLVWVPMWFLPHLFVVYVAAYIVKKNINFIFTQRYTILLSAFSLLLGVLYLDWHSVTFLFYDIPIVGLPFSIDLLFITIPFFLMGNSFKNIVIGLRVNKIYFYISCLVFFVFSYGFNTLIDLNLRIIELPFLSILLSFLGIYILLILSLLICGSTFIKRCFTYAGRYSLYILIFHLYLIANIYPQLAKYFGAFVPLSALAVLSLICGVVACIILGLVIEKNKYTRMLFRP